MVVEIDIGPVTFPLANSPADIICSRYRHFCLCFMKKYKNLILIYHIDRSSLPPQNGSVTPNGVTNHRLGTTALKHCGLFVTCDFNIVVSRLVHSNNEGKAFEKRYSLTAHVVIDVTIPTFNWNLKPRYLLKYTISLFSVNSVSGMCYVPNILRFFKTGLKGRVPPFWHNGFHKSNHISMRPRSPFSDIRVR